MGAAQDHRPCAVRRALRIERSESSEHQLGSISSLTFVPGVVTNTVEGNLQSAFGTVASARLALSLGSIVGNPSITVQLGGVVRGVPNRIVELTADDLKIFGVHTTARLDYCGEGECRWYGGTGRSWVDSYFNFGTTRLAAPGTKLRVQGWGDAFEKNTKPGQHWGDAYNAAPHDQRKWVPTG